MRKKDLKSWNFNTKFPSVEVDPDVNLLELSCGCICLACRQTYTAFWIEKSLTTELKVQVAAEKEASDEALKIIKDVENDFNRRLDELHTKYRKELDKNAILEGELEKERKGKVEEVYRKDVQDEEMRLTRLDNKSMTQYLIDYQQELNALRNENKDFQFSHQVITNAKEKMLQQLKEYEAHVMKVEAHNADLRQRFSCVDIENARLKGKNQHLKEKIYQLQEMNKSLKYLGGDSVALKNNARDGPQMKPIKSYISRSMSDVSFDGGGSNLLIRSNAVVSRGGIGTSGSDFFMAVTPSKGSLRGAISSPGPGFSASASRLSAIASTLRL